MDHNPNDLLVKGSSPAPGVINLNYELLKLIMSYDLEEIMNLYEKISGKPFETIAETIKDVGKKELFLDMVEAIRIEIYCREDIEKTLNNRVLSPDAYKKRTWI